MKNSSAQGNAIIATFTKLEGLPEIFTPDSPIFRNGVAIHGLLQSQRRALLQMKLKSSFYELSSSPDKEQLSSDELIHCDRKPSL